MDTFPISAYVPADTLSNGPMSANEANRLVHEVKEHFKNACEHKAKSRRVLWELHSRKGYTALGFATFEEMAKDTFSINRWYASALVRASEVERNLAKEIPGLMDLNLPERSLAVLYDVQKQNDISAAVRVWKKAVRLVSDKGRKIPTAAVLRKAAKELGCVIYHTSDKGVSNPIIDTLSSSEEAFEFAPNGTTVIFEADAETVLLYAKIDHTLRPVRVSLSEFRAMRHRAGFLLALDNEEVESE